MVIGLVQLQLPVIATRADVRAQAQRIVQLVGKARRNLPSMDLVVFPEYSLHQHTFMRDFVAGKYQLPWEAEVAHRDGTSCGIEAPTRDYAAPNPGASARARGASS